MDTNNIIKKVNKLILKINEFNDSKKFLVLGLSECPFSLKTKEYLKSHNLNYKFYNIDNYREIFFQLLNKLSDIKPEFNINLNHKTFPVIFYNNKFIGGFSDLVESHF